MRGEKSRETRRMSQISSCCIFSEKTKKDLQSAFSCVIIPMLHTQRYRSGHNGADSKSVCAKAHEGSNPSLCAKKERRIGYNYLCQFCVFYCFLGVFLLFESVKLNIIIKRAYLPRIFALPANGLFLLSLKLWVFVKIMSIR